ncbi:MAG: PDGLE domain-containing protein, partial [Ligilactobacillus sp.]|nr:PDGLE domain-containing protein [Ligilactobacillus sp.]
RANSKEASKMALGFKYFYYLIGAMILLSPLGLLASGTAWGEWDPSELLSNMHNEHLGSTLPTGMAHGMNFNALFGDYTVPGTTISLGYILSAITAVLVFLVLGKILMAVGKSNEHAN